MKMKTKMAILDQEMSQSIVGKCAKLGVKQQVFFHICKMFDGNFIFISNYYLPQTVLKYFL